MGEKWHSGRQEFVEGRVSDWDNKETSTGTGREIVHAFYVQHPDGKVTVEVKMGWFSVKPPTSWANVTILGEHTLLPNYTGPIVHYVSNRRRAR